MTKRYFKLCSQESYRALSDPAEIAELLTDWSWYEIPAWDYERRNRKFAHRVHITPAPESQQEHASGDNLGADDFRNEGTGYFDIA